ncbi:hypertrehalosaemic prohormone-like [Diabrotica virgifera virgifera]|uniref:Hypertrehalosaemic prohormone-like n=1 Tax=Diabrotica virgifera virgifera TaxID=50390 RepID=A0A6P7FDQ0_DIAVI|nr:hypertrehalosaemic prohormone-like [Diabrotica virgifera virgifera]
MWVNYIIMYITTKTLNDSTHSSNNTILETIKSLITFTIKMAAMKFIVIFVFTFFLGLSMAQVNFTPNWGKRSGTDDNNCDVNMELVKVIYNLLNSEAKRLVKCGRI